MEYLVGAIKRSMYVLFPNFGLINSKRASKFEPNIIEEVVPVTGPEVFAKVNLTRVSSRF